MKPLSKIEGACALRALRYAAGADEHRVIEACLMQGQFDEQWKAAANELGLRLEKILYRKTSLKKFVKMNPRDMYLICTHNHIFVLDNGRIIDPDWDNSGLYRMIVQAWRVI